jgi:hypothetical protein
MDKTTTMEQAGIRAEEDGRNDLLAADEMEGFRARWHAVQGSFVDEPRKAVQEADELVDSLVQRIVNSIADQRKKLETGWDRGQDISTEDLRQSLRKYRAFFDRLLTV